MNPKFVSTSTLAILVTLFLLTPAQSETTTPAPTDIDTQLMMATFRIEGPSADGHNQSLGTIFIVGNPHPTKPNIGWHTLVTAAHVLKRIKGDDAVVYFRQKLNNGNWVAVPTQIKIRRRGKPLWIEHSNNDVAAMYIRVPEEARFESIPMDMLANDDLLAKYNIHPGDVLDCLGYPFGIEASAGSFPILRSGKIASYPLLPTKTTHSFLLDFRIFPGNSGGPVYINFMGDRNDDVGIGNMVFAFIMGLVSHEVTLDEGREVEDRTYIGNTPVGLAKIVHASFIRETISLLPLPSH